MNVASLELCKELYELSGWDDTYFEWFVDKYDDHLTREPEPGHRSRHTGSEIFNFITAYDLGYLLRKLPGEITLPGLHYSGDRKNNHFFLEIDAPLSDEQTWGFYYSNGDESSFYMIEPTPEDAACKLAIELFKQGILTREEKAL